METYTDYAERERDAFASFRLSFAQKNRKPQPPSAVGSLTDGETYMLLGVTLASVLLTSLRTAEQFFRAAINSLLGAWLGWTEAVLAIIAIEGSMVVYSMIRAKKTGSSIATSFRIFAIGIAVLATISIVASLGQSINLMDEIPPEINNYIQWGLVIVIGPGGAMAALIGGHLLGSRARELADQNGDAMEEYKLDLAEWEAKLERSWNANRKKYIGDFQQPHTQSVDAAPSSRNWGRGELVGAIEDWFSTNRIDINGNPVDYAQVAREIGHGNPETVRVKISQMRNK